MALARDHHVVVAVHTQLNRLLQFECSQRSALAKNAGIAFFTAKAAAHAPANHFNIVGAQVQSSSSLTLIAIRVLR